MTIGLAQAMLREHRWSYAGLAAVLVTASTVVGTSFILFAAARPADLDVSGLGANEAAKVIGLAESGRFISAFMATLCVFIAVLLVSQAMSFVVDGRRSELALLRLIGATPSQVVRLVWRESITLGFGCSVVGSLLAVPLAGPYAGAMTQQGNWSPDVPVVVHTSALVWCVTVMTLVSVAGAAMRPRRIARTPPVAAVRNTPRRSTKMSPTQWTLAAVGLLTTAAFLAAPPRSINYQITTAGVGAGAVLLVSSLAPVIVPTVAHVFSGAVSFFAPGAGMVAREHTTHAAHRTAAMALPIVVLLGLSAVFGMMAQTGRSEKAVDLEALTHVDAVVDGDHDDLSADSLHNAAALPEVEDITPVHRDDGWAWADRAMPDDDYPQLMGIDPDSFTHFAPVHFVAGGINDVAGHDVASLAGHGDIGDVFTIEAPDGTLVTVRVAAVVEPTGFVYGTFLADLNGVSAETESSADTWLVEAAPGVSDPELIAALGTVASGHVLSHDTWVRESVTRSITDQRSTIVTLIGAAAALALASLIQSTLSSVTERRDELQLLTTLGARWRSVIGSVVVESGIIALTASTLAVAVIGLVCLRMVTAFRVLNPTLSPVIPTGILAATLCLCILACTGASWIGTVVALRQRGGRAEKRPSRLSEVDVLHHPAVHRDRRGR